MFQGTVYELAKHAHSLKSCLEINNANKFEIFEGYEFWEYHPNIRNENVDVIETTLQMNYHRLYMLQQHER